MTGVNPECLIYYCFASRNLDTGEVNVDEGLAGGGLNPFYWVTLIKIHIHVFYFVLFCLH